MAPGGGWMPSADQASPVERRRLHADGHHAEPCQAIERRAATDRPGRDLEPGRLRQPDGSWVERSPLHGDPAAIGAPIASATSAAVNDRVMSQRGQAGARRATRSSAAGVNDETTAFASPGPRPAASTPTTDGPGSSFNSTSRKGREPTALSTASRVGIPRAPSARAGSASTRSGPPMDPLERGVVADDRDAVGRRADVELEAVAGRDRQRCHEGRKRVLRSVSPVATMGEPQRAGRHLATRSRAVAAMPR